MLLWELTLKWLCWTVLSSQQLHVRTAFIWNQSISNIKMWFTYSAFCILHHITKQHKKLNKKKHKTQTQKSMELIHEPSDSLVVPVSLHTQDSSWWRTRSRGWGSPSGDRPGTGTGWFHFSSRLEWIGPAEPPRRALYVRECVFNRLWVWECYTVCKMRISLMVYYDMREYKGDNSDFTAQTDIWS